MKDGAFTSKDKLNRNNCNPSSENLTNLTDFSAKDRPWDVHRGQTDDIGYIYAAAIEFERYAARMDACSGVLYFGQNVLPETGEIRLRLAIAHFCRVRYCSTCQWRRALMWQARFYQTLPEITLNFPKARWLYLTLTVRNCNISDLKTTLSEMNKAWHRLVKRKEFKPVQGWIRTTEVTQGKNRSAHPHFHALLMVPPSWFKGKTYVKQLRWVEMWGECMRVDYFPNVDIRTVKPRKKTLGSTPDTDLGVELQGAVAETLKYSTKPSEMISNPEWFLELTRQTHKLRFTATGGALKGILKSEQETDKDLTLLGSEESQEEIPKLAFTWRPTERHYKRNPKKDQN